MKRLITAALAALTFAAPIALPSQAAAHEGRGNHDDRDRYDRRDDRRDERRDWRDDRRDERRDWRDERRDERRAYNDGYRDGRRDGWDRRRHNGYYHQGRWYYGPPPVHYRDVRYDYRAWRRGDRLPDYYRSSYREVDWRRHHLRQPPRGYHYIYNNDRDEYLLVGIATGVILGAILAQ